MNIADALTKFTKDGLKLIYDYAKTGKLDLTKAMLPDFLEVSCLADWWDRYCK